MRSLSLALRQLRREWRSGELAVLWLSLCVAVAALCGVGFLVDRIGRAVTAQASEVLAADLRVESDAAIDPAEQAHALSSGLTSARLTMTLSAIFNGDSNQLADVRAVSDRVAHARDTRARGGLARFAAGGRAGCDDWHQSECRLAHAARGADPDLAARPELDLRRVCLGAAHQ
jgi:putative ABC transport system permease protein